MALITSKHVKRLEAVIASTREQFSDIDGYTAWTTQRVEDATNELFGAVREAVDAGHASTVKDLLMTAAMETPDSDSGTTLWLTVIAQSLGYAEQPLVRR
jgi:hypothetical protein